MDARLVTDEIAGIMAKIKWLNFIRFGCDTPVQVKECERAISLLREHGCKKDFLLYTMLHGDIRECYERINYWREKQDWKITCFPQPYLDFTKTRQNIPQWQKDMARWAIKKEIYISTDFMNYEPRKGFYCREYFK